MTISLAINSIENYVGNIREHVSKWGNDVVPWFRGEPEVDTPLLPKVFRKLPDGGYHNENNLLQMFRVKAANFSGEAMPPRNYTDQWLFLAQHVGLPTRLLDWTESALVGLYFALKHEKPVVWMLDPFRLNELSISVELRGQPDKVNSFPLTWIEPDHYKNIGIENIKGAWELGYDGIDLPVAVQPTYLHPRMSAQRSVFTVHGAKKAPLCDLVPEDLLRKFIINNNSISQMLKDLRMLGINESTAFPDLDGLSRELSGLY